MQRMSKYRVDDDWINCEMAYLKKRMKFDDSDAVLTTETSVPILFALLEEIKARRESEEDSAGATQEKPVLPIPCTKGYEKWTVKQWFAKINEELDEVKDAILSIVELEWKPEGGTFAENDVNVIAEEAADTITAITSMLEAMGIDEQQRQAAQMRVNEHNRQRGRL